MPENPQLNIAPPIEASLIISSTVLNHDNHRNLNQ